MWAGNFGAMRSLTEAYGYPVTVCGEGFSWRLRCKYALDQHRELFENLLAKPASLLLVIPHKRCPPW